MKQTANYQLTQWEKTDRIQMEGFNSDNAKVDAAMKTLSDGLAVRGNCQIYHTTYVGTGTHQQGAARSMTFPHTPMLVFISDGTHKVWVIRDTRTSYGTLSGELYTFTWQNKKVYWYGRGEGGQYNLDQEGVTYHVLALLDMEN